MEAFNTAVQKWVPVDPMVTKTVAKGFRFEPPANDRQNGMSYVVAFEEDGSARDVTRRYAHAFNAKTRKQRVESTRGGEAWWEQALLFYEKPFLEDRDQIEGAEFRSKMAAEPMPRNVQDFKDHPFYALERHLRRNETIYPKRVVGHVGSRAGSKRNCVETVYRRSDVHTLRSANGWYRLGRDIKLGEQPLKHVPANRKVTEATGDDNHSAGQYPMETPLYAYFQTTLYEPPPVVEGLIPKNVYGNLDVYVPSMVPHGAVHIRHRDAARAARILGIDYAEAVTGFNFKGRHGTAVFDGVVVAREFAEALRGVIQGLEDEQLQYELEAKSAQALGLWKHFLLRLRIAERVKGYAVEREETDVAVSGDDRDDVAETAGGFLPDPGQDASNLVGHASPSAVPEAGESLGGGFLGEESTENADQSLAQDAFTAKGTPERSQPRFILSITPNSKSKSKKAANQNAAGPSSNECVQIKDEVPDEMATVSQEAPADGIVGSSENPVTIESSTEGEPNVGSVGKALSRSPKVDHEESDSNVDVVSLLSEDPEDEDAVPEWLM